MSDGVEVAMAFPPHVLREYALLADGQRGALVGPRGDIAWLCAPSWDSAAVFSSLLGGGGCYAVTPADPRFVWGGYYEEGTLIWRSRWITTGGVIECREALAYPGDPGTVVLLRRIEASGAPARVRVLLDAQADFGHYQMTRLKSDGGVWAARSGPLRLRWSGGAKARHADGGALELILDLQAGEHHDLVLEISDQVLGDDLVDAARAWEATAAAWASAVPALGPSLAPRESRHSYAVLAGLTSTGGGMVAAATMSLPERARAGRNYDYRYVWIRDQCYAGQAVAADGPHPLMDDAVAFVAARILTDGPQLRPAYTITGGPVPGEQSLPGLAGYPGGAVKTGNWVNQQFQLDALGEALLLFTAAARHDHLDTGHWAAAEAAAAAIEARWTDPDAGVWELDNQHWTHSRLMCTAGLKAIASAGAPARQAGHWEALADAILADAATDGLHPDGRWQRAPSDDRVDAALLLPAIRGATTTADSRTLATLEAVTADLARDGYLYRFRHDQRPLHEAEGAFVLCGFLMALALHQQGRTAEAVGWLERSKAACGAPGLLTEEYDVPQRQLRGNLPQAFVHALLIESAARLARPWDTP
ncbi:MAG: glycoside hydrolase family 15 protein [Actinomycetota bacterium]